MSLSVSEVAVYLWWRCLDWLCAWNSTGLTGLIASWRGMLSSAVILSRVLTCSHSSGMFWSLAMVPAAMLKCALEFLLQLSSFQVLTTQWCFLVLDSRLTWEIGFLWHVYLYELRNKALITGVFARHGACIRARLILIDCSAHHSHIWLVYKPGDLWYDLRHCWFYLRCRRFYSFLKIIKLIN